MIFVLEACG